MNHICVYMFLRRYDIDDLQDPYAHLTNTARGAELINFDEGKFVKVGIQ